MKLRSLVRKTGLNRVLAGLWSRGNYEDRFGSALLDAIRAGDTVWDIGANVGIYTEKFLAAVGATGRVVAFEPTEACHQEIARRVGDEPRLTTMLLALGAERGSITMTVENDAFSVTHRVIPTGATTVGPTKTVMMSSAAIVCEENPSLFPNVVKIDVEGHEGAVVEGMKPILADPRIRCVGVEVHFALLEARQEIRTPRAIESTLTAAGFRVTWVDPSHIVARRDATT
jgi:FkbM family methyltransferase